DMTLLDAAYGRLWQQLGEASGFAERMTLCGAWLQARSNGLTPRERALNHFLSDSRDVDITVSKLSAQLCYSSRQLARQLRALTGRNTEETLLFRKYLHALDRVHRSDESLTGIAYASGFSDQAHFIRTFRACTGMTPGAYRRQRSHLAGHLFEDVR
ncbi:MAG: AraC family transcriptional regulator, partial [Chitinophagaceae bacterium]